MLDVKILYETFPLNSDQCLLSILHRWLSHVLPLSTVPFDSVSNQLVFEPVPSSTQNPNQHDVKFICYANNSISDTLLSLLYNRGRISYRIGPRRLSNGNCATATWKTRNPWILKPHAFDRYGDISPCIFMWISRLRGVLRHVHIHTYDVFYLLRRIERRVVSFFTSRCCLHARGPYNAAFCMLMRGKVCPDRRWLSNLERVCVPTYIINVLFISNTIRTMCRKRDVIV